MKSVSEGFKRLTGSMCNFDNSIDDGLDESLREGGCYCNHTAWNFCGDVLFADGQFHEAIFRYRIGQEVMSAATLEALMKMVNDKYGWE